MEWWNIGMLFLKGNISIINPPVNKNITNNHDSNFSEPIIPSFHHSSIPIRAKPLVLSCIGTSLFYFIQELFDDWSNFGWVPMGILRFLWPRKRKVENLPGGLGVIQNS
jgi:hypothetical protein